MVSENLRQLRRQRPKQFEHDALSIIPWAYIPASQVILPGSQDHADVVAKSSGAKVAFEGTSIEIEWPDNSRIFDGRWVSDLFGILYEYLSDLEGPDYKSSARKQWGVRSRISEYHTLLYAVKISYLCAKDIASEVLSGSDYDDDDEYDPVGHLLIDHHIPPGMVAYTRAHPYRWPTSRFIGDLSAGTQELYLWALHLALKMWWHYEFHIDKSLLDDNTEWYEKPAILLIDEIENHLHPTWQRRVIPALLKYFPGLQIFATTHSPFVVAGLKAGQVHVLKRDDNGVVTASTEQRDVVGWTADEILRGMMGVDDPTDDATAQAARELRKLRQEGPRESEKDEEERQRQIQELRQLVNRDLLAGGPLAAQRELFEQNLAEILEEHRKKQGLSQD